MFLLRGRLFWAPPEAWRRFRWIIALITATTIGSTALHGTWIGRLLTDGVGILLVIGICYGLWTMFRYHS